MSVHTSEELESFHQSQSFDELNKRITELGAKLIEQDHRLVPVLTNFFSERKKYKIGDPRHIASYKALFWHFVSPRTAVTAGVGFAAILGLVLTFQANRLLVQQNKKLDTQNRLAESSRRASLIFELTSINEAISQIKPDQSTGKITLPHFIIGRLISISASFKPYYYLTNYDYQDSTTSIIDYVTTGIKQEGPILNASPLSPERAQLFITLFRGNFSNLLGLIPRMNLSYSDFRNENLIEANLVGANLERSDFEGANVSAAQFFRANLENAKFVGSSCISTQFGNKSVTNFNEERRRKLGPDNTNHIYPTILSKVDFSNANLIGASFNEAYISGAIFKNAVLIGCDFKGVFPANNIDIEGAIVGDSLWVHSHRMYLSKKDADKWKVVKERVDQHPMRLALLTMDSVWVIRKNK